MTRVAIIGTAGRRSDGDRLTFELYQKMCERVDSAVRHLRDLDLQSGGAAWADHIAVELFLHGVGRSLTLHLPAPLVRVGQRLEYDEAVEAGRTANYYHRLFDEKVPGFARSGVWQSMACLDLALARGAVAHTGNGFHDRNLRVGDCDVLIALTFGRGAVPKDGGTKHCWDHSMAPLKLHVPLDELAEVAAQLSLEI